jgi:hypothetical protein
MEFKGFATVLRKDRERKKKQIDNRIKLFE